MDFQAARTRMVDNQVRTTDVTDYEILKAMLSVPREEFVPANRRELAYIDEDIPVAPGRYLMEPSPFAKLLQLADIRPQDHVLDVGCATGYSTAVIGRMARSVVGLESDPALAAAAASTLDRLGIGNCTVVEGPLVDGCAQHAPYDVIFIEGAVQRLPDAFFEQIKIGGRIVVVEGVGNAALARLFLKEAHGVVSDRIAFNCCVKALPGFGREQSFVF
ncbi:protein-L-isoaspartate O-methyltransferase family protein [Mangrovicella endophytica]|uniref:protein-L-isoaspartate O-methyltransferase family protein n=1 Tax=Mangrovicella endophytica TaxID=2066697 RepID=UPI000C9DCAD5|nr:protein-L-isoaspartate O-methyltransferase [Mangrovicella endophytica]